MRKLLWTGWFLALHSFAQTTPQFRVDAFQRVSSPLRLRC